MEIKGVSGAGEPQRNIPLRGEILSHLHIVPPFLEDFPLAPLLEATLDEGVTLKALAEAVKKRGKIRGV